MQHTLRRLGASTLAFAVGTGLVLAAPGAATAVVDEDAAPVAGGATWLSGELTNGVLHNEQFAFDDYGLSIDAAFALDAAGGHDDAVQRVADAIAANLEAYTSYVPAPGAEPHVLAGSLAKALALTTVAGRDGRSFGGHDLVAELEAQVATEGANTGRIEDTYDPAVAWESDFANTIGQAFAAMGLDAEGGDLTGPVTDFLLQQQCAEGFFRLNFAPAGSDNQTCDGDAAAAPDTDVTALSVIALQSQLEDAGVRSAVTRATEWLVAAQQTDGSWGGGTSTETPNTNSTGLATTALGLVGETEAAARGAAWVAELQVTEVGRCAASPIGADTGAIAYDAAAAELGQDEGITVATRDQWRRATVQALPALRYLESAPTTAPLTLTAPTGYRAAGSKVTLRLAGLGAGETACVAGAPVTGPATSVVVTLPAGTGTRTFRADRLGAPSNAARVAALGAKRIPLFLKRARVSVNGTQTVRATGLAAGERVRIFLRGKPVASGQATKAGVFARNVKVGSKLGRTGVKVQGQFANRVNSKSFKVVR